MVDQNPTNFNVSLLFLSRIDLAFGLLHFAEHQKDIGIHIIIDFFLQQTQIAIISFQTAFACLLVGQELSHKGLGFLLLKHK